MDREYIIKLAQESGLLVIGTADGGNAVYTWPSGITDELARFAALVAEHTLMNIDPSKFMSWHEGYEAGVTAERNACAKEADAWSKREDDVGAFIGKAIRARGKS